MQSCSPIASASAVACRLRPLQLLLPGPIAASASTAAPHLPPLPAAALRLRPLQLLLAACVRFSCCSRTCPLRLLLHDYVRFNCCSPIASASTAARPIMFASTAAPQLRLLAGVRGSVNKLKYEGRVSLV